LIIFHLQASLQDPNILWCFPVSRCISDGASPDKCSFADVPFPSPPSSAKPGRATNSCCCFSNWQPRQPRLSTRSLEGPREVTGARHRRVICKALGQTRSPFSLTSATRGCKISHTITQCRAPVTRLRLKQSSPKGLQPRSEDRYPETESPTVRLALVPLLQNIFSDAEVSSVSNTSGFRIQTLGNLAHFSPLN